MPPVANDMLPMVAQALDMSEAVLAIVERTGAGALVVRQVNGAFCRAFAAEAGALEGMPLAALAMQDQSEKLAPLAAAAARGETHRTELLCLRPNGGRFWLGLTLLPASQPGGADNLFVMLGRDITRSRQETEQQNAVQRLLATVFAAAEAGLAIIGSDGRFMMTNGFHDRLFGYEPGSLVGRQSTELLAPESREAVRGARAQQLLDARRYAVDAVALAADGGQVPVTLVSGVVSPTDRERYRVVTVIPRGPTLRPAKPLQIQLAGKIRLVSLEAVKAALGDRWNGMVERVMDSAERIVAREMTKGDTFFRTRDHGFVVCLPNVSEEEATFRAAALAREIRHRLIGDGEDPSAVEVSVVVAAVPVPANRREPGHAATERHLADVERQLHAEPWPGPASDGCCYEQVIGPESGPLLGHFMRALWPRRGDRAAGVVALPPDRLDSDVATLRFAERVADDPPGSTELLFVEVDFDCFYSRAKSQMLVDVCGSFAPAMRARLVLLLAGLPEAVAKAHVLEHSRVLDSVQRLRPFCRAVGYVLDAPELRAADVSMTTGTFVLLNAHAWDRSPALAHARITKLAAGLHARRTSLMARGIDTAGARNALRDCGVNLFVLGTP